ncbi:hypothetical protein BOX15_Mlig025520g3 [Macrostomum lignano]|uniref:Methylcytosine dioxygenase TET n=1 Tax=Macrostomum lignano TaxID=282301 RepID=A0A267DBF8_9PLAT|nr:hypothetical protein BOX15_Mlig025520g3 [Macrostomum lignano]
METDVIKRDPIFSTSTNQITSSSPLEQSDLPKLDSDSTTSAAVPTSYLPAVDRKQKKQMPPVQDRKRDLSPQVCNCLPEAMVSTDSPPAYRHLGAASTVQELRCRLETSLCLQPASLRIETVMPSEREGATERGCPAAKWVLRRTGEQEKFLALVRVRQGHACPTAVIVVALVSWEGLPRELADRAFDYLSGELPHQGIPIERRCAANESRTCGCQGFDDATCGASYSFGCSWSMFHNACKFARTREQARKFRLRSLDAETELACRLNCLADVAGRVLEAAAPEAFQAQVQDSQLAADCRLGCNAPPDKRPFSGVTACIDFCMHAHKDTFALDGGCNVVVTLTSSRSTDEQLHVLPGYMPGEVDEFGSEVGQRERITNGAIQELRHVNLVTRVRGSPMAPCAVRKKIKKSAQQQVQQKPQQGAQKQLHNQKAGKAVTSKEEHSPASIDSGFESIKSNRSPDKDEQQHFSPPMMAAVAPVGILPPIASWFRKSPVQWTPPQQQLQRHQQPQQQLQQMIPPAPQPQPPTHVLPPPPPPMPQTPNLRDTRCASSGSQLQLQEQYAQHPQSQKQQHTNASPHMQFHPRGPRPEFTQPHPPAFPQPSYPPIQQPQQAQLQPQPQPQQHSYQQMGSWHQSIPPHYQLQQQPRQGYAPRYPVEHPAHQYPGGYPGQWRPQYPQHGYYNQHQQTRGIPPSQYRQYPYPTYQHNSMQHSAFDMDYPHQQPHRYPQNPNKQYPHMHQQYPAQQHQLQYPHYPSQQQQPQQQQQKQNQKPQQSPLGNPNQSCASDKRPPSNLCSLRRQRDAAASLLALNPAKDRKAIESSSPTVLNYFETAGWAAWP